MEPLQDSEAIQQFIQLLEENNRQGQAADLSHLMWYIDGMNRQYEAVLRELQEVRQQLSQEQKPTVRQAVQKSVEKIECKALQFKDMLDEMREKIAECAAIAVERFKEAGVSALDQAVAAIGVKNDLESFHEKIGGMIDDTKQAVANVESVGHELRSAGGHLKNAGRAMVGRNAQPVDGGREGRLQSAVLAPLRVTQNLLSHMNNMTLAAIGRVESLEVSAEAAREARAERKSSVRQALAEKKGEIAARTAPVADRSRKAPEAAR